MQIKKRTERFTKDVATDEYSSCISCPEYVASHITESIKEFGNYEVILELCSCVGSLCIQLAKYFDKVIGIELDADRVEKSKTNASIYEVSENTEFIEGDVLDEKLLSSFSADLVILDPEWSKVKMDRSTHATEIDSTQPSLREMIRLTKKHITNEIVIRFPEKMDFKSFEGCELGEGKIETIFINDQPVFKVGYFLSSISENHTEDIKFE